MQDWKMTNEVARVEIDGLENDWLEIDGPKNGGLEKAELEIDGLENDGQSIEPI